METKNVAANRSRSGTNSCRARVAYGDCAVTRPAKNAPKAIERPAASPPKATPLASAKTVIRNSSRECAAKA